MTDPKKKTLSTKRQCESAEVEVCGCRVDDRGIASRTRSKCKKNKTIKNSDDNELVQGLDSDVWGIVVEFLSTPSLVAISGCNKSCQATVKKEVKSRKDRIAKMANRVKGLLGLNHDEKEDESRYWERVLVPTLENVLGARRLCQEAKRIVDTDLYWQDRIHSESWEHEDFEPSMDKFFEEERKLLQSYDGLRMLPPCFYLSLQGTEEPSPELVKEHVSYARRSVLRVWYAEDHMGFVHEMYGSLPKYQEDPFFKFNCPHADFFVEIVNETACDFAFSVDHLAALRFAAREIVSQTPNSRDYVHFLIHRAEKRAQTLFESDDDY